MWPRLSDWGETMHMHLQNLIVLAVVAGAVFYLVRRMTRSAQGHDGGGCSKCSCNEGEKKAV
jgi:hypothetical protein